MAQINRIRVEENFHLNEFECPHCKTVKLCPELLDRLQKMRSEAGAPLFINSGYRCPPYNREVSGVPGSQHVEGTAADIRIQGMSVSQLHNMALRYFPDGGVGLYNSFVHVDTRGHQARWDYS